MNLIERFKLWWSSLFDDKPVVKLDGNLDLVIEGKEVITEDLTSRNTDKGKSTKVDTLPDSPKAKKVSKKKKASKKRPSKKKKSSKKKEK